MIRIYLDWNVVSNFKLTEFSAIRNFIAKHKSYLQFPYSPAHFKDLMKSYNPDNEFFKADLDNLEYLSEKHLIRWGNKGIEPLFGTPKEYFETEKDSEDVFSLMDIEKVLSDLDDKAFGTGKLGGMIKLLFQTQPTGIQLNDENREMLKKMFPNINENSTMWDLMKDIAPFSKKLLQDKEYYKDFRKTIGDQGFKLETNAGNWSEDEVIKNIDSFLQRHNPQLTFNEYISSCFKQKKEPVSRYEYYTTAYLLLDMIGYKSDKLPKPTDNMQNIQNDGEHSFYAAHCDFFVVIDKKLKIKTKVLFKEFNIPTIVLSPDELIEILTRYVHIIDQNTFFLDDALTLVKNGKIVEEYPTSDENEVETYAIKLPQFYFNFFNYAVYENYEKQNGIILTFKKVFKTYSNFIYYTEAERLIERVTDFFGYEDKMELEEKKEMFVYGNEEVDFTWNFRGGIVKLEKDSDTKRPLLTYVISTLNE